MATANNTINTRIKLKSDTEANWNKLGPKDNSAGFVPLQGELIVYSTDNTHMFSRLKIGDGQTNVVNLPFVDAGSLNGDESIICKYNSFNNFPQLGSTQCLYLDTSTGQMYHYDAILGYRPIATVSLNATTSTVREVVFWGAGTMSNASINNNVLRLENGSPPELFYRDTTVLTGVQIGGNN